MVTVKPLQMTGVFAPLAYDFLALKRAQGYKYLSEEKVLCRFCRFAEEFGAQSPVLTRELVLAWTAVREGEAKKSRMHRITCAKQFGNYLQTRGLEACAPPSQSHWNRSSFTPYIFSHEEIERLFRAADNVRPVPASRNMHRLLPVLIRLLYGCGLRVSEAVGLRCGDIDLEKGILTIRQGKNGKDRLVPLSGSLLAWLRDYRNQVITWANEDDFFFMAPDRSMLSPNTVYQRYRQLLWNGGICYGGPGKGPRLHDLRHTFAVHALQQWVERGEDLTAMLPALSTFMGHKSFAATSGYLRLTAEVYPEVVRRVEETCAYAIPGGERQ